MPAHVEREFKLRIPSEAALQALAARLGMPGTAVLQVNHFFDTAARDLARGRVALRLREEGGTRTLALKGPALAAPAGLAARREEELVLAPAEARAVLAGNLSPLALYERGPAADDPLVRHARALVGAAELLRLGAFENERLRIGPLAFPPGSSGPGLVLELDRTRFPGGVVERELEVELPEGADAHAVRSALEALLTDFGIEAQRSPSKAARFFRLLDEQR